MQTNPFDRPVPTLAQQQQYMIDAVNESGPAADVILTEVQIRHLDEELGRLYAQRDAADARIREIVKALVDSGEARLTSGRRPGHRNHREGTT